MARHLLSIVAGGAGDRNQTAEVLKILNESTDVKKLSSKADGDNTFLAETSQPSPVSFLGTYDARQTI